MLNTKVGACVCMCIVCIVWSILLGEIGDLWSPPKSPHWGDFGGGLWIKNTIGGLSRYLRTGKKFEMKISTKKSQMPTPSLTIFIFALSPKRALLVCLFLQRKERKGGRYTPIGHSSFAMWLLFYKLAMLETKVGACVCMGIVCIVWATSSHQKVAF